MNDVKRDLACPDLWADSLTRSRERREAAARRGDFQLVTQRSASVAATLAIAGGTAAGFLAGPATSADSALAASIRHGGSGVAELQRKLGVGADGVFGPQTKRAVKQWQRAHGLTADGIVGPATRQAIGLRGGAVLKTASAHGSRHHRVRAAISSHRSGGGGVRALQRKLGVGADGVFGAQTKRAVKQWQRAHGLTADGIVGPATRQAMDLGGGGVLKARSSGHHRRHRAHSAGRRSGGGGVAALQRKLGIGADGAFGAQTKRAVKQWQSAHGLTADGVVGPATRQAMGLGAGGVLKAGGRGDSSSSGGGGNSHAVSVVSRAVAAGNQIANTPYVWGGGHGSFSSSGYDCSGSVSYVLHGAGLLSSPLDSSALEGFGEPGPGKHITIYANAGHTYMTIDGRRYDTSARSVSGSRWTSEQRSSAGYVVRHPAGL